ncbi:MAG: hypothetical protein VYD08_09615, partial [Pseudomonadota bacterium]|nr:hypothetical protein [Pseudomonadota bacterium]
DDQQWRCEGNCKASPDQVQSLVSKWKNLAISSTTQRPQGEAKQVILLFGNDNYAEVELYSQPTLILRLPQQDQLFLVENATQASLTPHH